MQLEYASSTLLKSSPLHQQLRNDLASDKNLTTIQEISTGQGNKSLTQGHCFSILCQIFLVAAKFCNKYADVSIYLMQVLNHCSLMDNKS